MYMTTTTVYDNQSIAFRDLIGNTATISPNVGFTIATPLKTLTADVDGFTNGTQTLSFTDLYAGVEKARAIKFDTSTLTKLSVRDTVEIIDDTIAPTQKTSITQQSISLSAVGGAPNSLVISNDLSGDPAIDMVATDPNATGNFSASQIDLQFLTNGRSVINSNGDMTLFSYRGGLETKIIENITSNELAVRLTDDDTGIVGSLTNTSVLFSKTGSPERIEINNSPDGITDIRPYLKIQSEDPNYQYNTTITSETIGATLTSTVGDPAYRVDVKPTEIVMYRDVDINGNPISRNIMGYSYNTQYDPATTANLYMSDGNRLQLKYDAPNSREIDIFNDTDSAAEPYIKVRGSDPQFSSIIKSDTIEVRQDTGVNDPTYSTIISLNDVRFKKDNYDLGGIGYNYFQQLNSTSFDNVDIQHGNYMRFSNTTGGNQRIVLHNDITNSEPYMEIRNSNSTTLSTLNGTSLTFTAGATTNTLNAQQWSGNIQTVNTSANLTHYLNFSDSSGTGYGKPQKTSGIFCNPSTNTITATTFSGSLNGNASSSSAVSLTSDDTPGSYFLPFSKTISSNSALFIDNTTTPLTYNPHTSTLSTSNLSIVEKIEVLDNTITPTYTSELIPTSLTITEISSANYSSLGYTGLTIVNTAGVSNTLTPNDMIINNTISGETNTIDQNSITMTSPLGSLNQVIISNDISASEPFIRIDDSLGRPTLYYNNGLTSDSGFCYTLDNGTRFLKQKNPFSFKFTEIPDGGTIEQDMPFVMVQNGSGIKLLKVAEYLDDLGEVGWSCIICNYGASSITIDINNASGWFGGSSSGLEITPIIIRQFCTVRITLVYSTTDGYIWAVSRF